MDPNYPIWQNGRAIAGVRDGRRAVAPDDVSVDRAAPLSTRASRAALSADRMPGRAQMIDCVVGVVRASSVAFALVLGATFVVSARGPGRATQAPPVGARGGGFGGGGNAFSAIVDPREPVTFTNPVIPGFFSDPSVTRAGEDCYPVNSTFEYFPGVPVFHGKDLVNWELIGCAIHRATQLPKGLNIFATTVRHHAGTFYMITTNTGAGGSFYVTATNPAGPWSDPVWTEAQGIDPDLFFDGDGKTYVVSSTFELHEIDLKTGTFVSEGRRIWNGTGGRSAEGPHIDKKEGFYYVMAAEGGTEEAHSETIARSKSIWGPYNTNPANPILAHANAAGQGNPIQGVGHADVVQAHGGSYWIVFHGYRTVGGGVQHILGRELAP
jgi:xylan 1,4-beta-xylosidase